MLIRKCDRCGNIIKNNYWTIDIYQREDSTGRITAKGAINNLLTNSDKITNSEKEYCEECIDDINRYINTKPKE